MFNIFKKVLNIPFKLVALPFNSIIEIVFNKIGGRHRRRRRRMLAGQSLTPSRTEASGVAAQLVAEVFNKSVSRRSEKGQEQGQNSNIVTVDTLQIALRAQTVGEILVEVLKVVGRQNDDEREEINRKRDNNNGSRMSRKEAVGIQAGGESAVVMGNSSKQEIATLSERKQLGFSDPPKGETNIASELLEDVFKVVTHGKYDRFGKDQQQTKQKKGTHHQKEIAIIGTLGERMVERRNSAMVGGLKDIRLEEKLVEAVTEGKGVGSSVMFIPSTPQTLSTLAQSQESVETQHPLQQPQLEKQSEKQQHNHHHQPYQQKQRESLRHESSSRTDEKQQRLSHLKFPSSSIEERQHQLLPPPLERKDVQGKDGLERQKKNGAKNQTKHSIQQQQQLNRQQQLQQEQPNQRRYRRQSNQQPCTDINNLELDSAGPCRTRIDNKVYEEGGRSTESEKEQHLHRKQSHRSRQLQRRGRHEPQQIQQKTQQQEPQRRGQEQQQQQQQRSRLPQRRRQQRKQQQIQQQQQPHQLQRRGTHQQQYAQQLRQSQNPEQQERQQSPPLQQSQTPQRRRQQQQSQQPPRRLRRGGKQLQNNQQPRQLQRRGQQQQQSQQPHQQQRRGWQQRQQQQQPQESVGRGRPNNLWRQQQGLRSVQSNDNQGGNISIPPNQRNGQPLHQSLLQEPVNLNGVGQSRQEQSQHYHQWRPSFQRQSHGGYSRPWNEPQS